MNKFHLYIILIVSFLCSAVFSYGQDADELPRSDVYGELSKYLSWPMSATAVSGDDIMMMGRENDRDLADVIPNFSKTDTGIRSFGDVISMRGLTNTPFFSSASVVQYIDDVPTGNVFSHSSPLHAVDRVEILRGPQGTLFGRNPYAGVINVVSRRPSDIWEGSISSSYGSYESFTTDAYLMGPLSDNNLSLRLGGQLAERDGFLNNSTLGISPDHQEHVTGSGALYWNPSNDWEISFSATYEDYDDGIARLTPLSGDPFTLNSDIEGTSQQSADSQALRLSYEGESVNFLSVTSHRNWQLNPYHFDLDFGPFPGNESLIIQDQDAVSQEFRFSSVDEGEWEWNGGAFFGKTDVEGDTTRNFLIPLPPQFGGGFSPAVTTTDYVLSEDAYALFGQVSYNGFDRTGVHVGLRVDQTDKSIERSALGIDWQTLQPVQIAPINLSDDYMSVSPRGGIDYELDDSSLVYINTGLSTKPGGFSAFINSPADAPYDEEKAWTTEIGLKKKWLNDRLRTNAAVFHSDIEDYQVERSLIATDYAVLNAAEAESYGAEIEFSAEIFEGFTLSGSIGTVHTEFTTFNDPLTGDDLSGNTAPFVPDMDASVSATYRHEGGFFARLEVIHQGLTYFDDRNNYPFEEDGYSLLNAAVGYQAESGLEVSVFGGNLTDEVYYVNMTPDLVAGAVGSPQIVGVRVRWDF